MKKLFSLMLCAALLLSCTACWDYTEVNMQDYAFGMAIDKEEGEYKVCIETLKVKGSPEQAGSSRITVKTTGANLFDAIRYAITHAGKKLYWGHFQLAIIGESAAEDTSEILDVLSRAQDVYLNVALLLARDSTAEEIITAKIPRDTMVTDHIMEIFDNQKPSRHFMLTEIWQVYRDMSYSDTYILPTVTLNDDDIPEINGSAVFKSGKLSGFLTGEETVILSLLSDDASGGYLPLVEVSPELNVSLEISQSRVSTRAEMADGMPELYIESQSMVSLSRTSGKCNIMDKVTQNNISKAAEREMSRRAEALCRRIQQDELGDPLYWARVIQAAYPDWWEKNSENWDEIIKTIPIHRDIQVSLNSAGMTKHTLTFD